MTIPANIYPRTNDRFTVYLQHVVHNPNIRVGEYTMYHDFVSDPTQFEKTTCFTSILLTTISSSLANFVPLAVRRGLYSIAPTML